MPQNSASMPRLQRPPAPQNGNGRPQPGQASIQMPIPPRPPAPGQASAQLPIPPDVDKTTFQAAVAPPNQQTGSNPVPPALQRPQPPAERPAPPEHPAPPERKPLPPRTTDISMTTEMEAISESVQEIRRVDATLARFSAVHDELAEEERLKKEKRERLMPWLKAESEGGEEPDALAEDQAAGTFDEELAQLETVLTRPAEQPRRKPARKLALAGRITSAALALILLLATGYAWKVTNVDGQIRQVDALDPNSSAIADAPAQLGDENFLMVGSDTREGADAEDGVGNADAVPGARSDTIMVAHIPKDRKRVVMVSFPRDLEIQRPECDRYDAKTGKYSTDKSKPAANQKINTAFQVGGPKCVTKVIQTLTGLRINHFVGIDFNGFKDMVQAVQGVEVCVERPMYDTELKTWIVQTPGQNVKLEGDAALNFVRARHVQDSPAKNAKGDPTSDYGRIKRQQRFLSSLLRKAMSGQVLLDPGKLSDFINAFGKATFGDGIGTQDLITLGRSLQNVGAGKVTFITVPTVGESNKRGNEELREKDNKNLFTAIINEQTLPGEQAEQTPQGQAQNKPPDSLKAPDPVDPKNVKVQVLNAGAGDGKANPAANALRSQGFQIMRTDNSSEKLPKSVVRYGSAEAAAQLVASTVAGATVQKDDSVGGAVILLLGQDYNGKITQAKAGTTAPNTGGGGGGSATPPPASPLPGDLATVNAGDTKCA
jgi:LCP family protein required for cell wall assembly